MHVILQLVCMHCMVLLLLLLLSHAAHMIPTIKLEASKAL